MATASPIRSHFTPRAFRHASVLAQSAPVEKFSSLVRPSAIVPNMAYRWEMDLSPGTLIDPPKFLAGRITTDFLSGIGLLNISEPVEVGMVPNGHRSGRAFSRLTISREPVDRLNPQQPRQIFGGYSYMRWFIVSALFLF